MSRLLCCRRQRARRDMGAALSLHPQEGEACDGAGGPAAPPTMADVIRERKKKAGGAGLGTLRRRIAAAARRHSDSRPDRGCEHARFIRSVVSSWRLAEVFLLCQELEAGAALRDLATQAELAREPAAALPAALHAQARDRRWCDVTLGGAGWALPAHRALLAARCSYFRALLHRHPSGGCRVPLDGPCANITRAECEALLAALYAGPCALHCRTRHDRHCERGFSSDGNLDIINVEGTGSCSCSLGSMRGVRRLAERLGARLDDLHRDMRYLLDSGEYADARLSFAAEGGGQFGFRAALELPCHRVVLAARSRFFRSAMSRRSGSGVAAGVVCVDETVLPRRFARALLHAAYTDQVDLTLIGRNTNSPNNTTSSSSGWSVGRGSSRAPSTAMLDDAFQLYEIARFLEMPIVAQGCEDAIQAALSPATLPHVLRWSAGSVASQWVNRQAMRYLRDEFPTIMSHAAAARLPRTALAAALASPFTQCSEAQALRALLRLAERGKQAEPNVVWSSSAGGRRRSLPDAEALGPLAALLRTSHLAPAALAAAARRGLLPAPAPPRPDPRPPRYFLPYLDELKALLEDQPVPEAEIARIRRSRNQHRIPDTLYMVAAERNATAATTQPASSAAESACVSPRVLASLRARVRELRSAPPAARALALPASDTRAVRTQIALRAVREQGLPDSCAELLLAEPDSDTETSDRERGWESPRPERAEPWPDADCCRASGGGSLRCSSAGSLRGAHTQHAHTLDRAGTCRREPSRLEAAHNRAGWTGAAGAELSARVPDVAMAPNGNTHLLTPRHYCRPPKEYGGGILQLDLGDGATHTPRPERRQDARIPRASGCVGVPRRSRSPMWPGHERRTRAQRAAAGGSRQHRDHSQAARARNEEDELRAAIELSVMRAYSSFGCRARLSAAPHYALPPATAPAPAPSGCASRGSPSPSNSAHLSAPAAAAASASAPAAAPAAASAPRERDRAPLRALSAAAGSAAGAGARTPSPRRARPLYRAQTHGTGEYRGGAEGPYGRAHSPGGFA